MGYKGLLDWGNQRHVQEDLSCVSDCSLESVCLGKRNRPYSTAVQIYFIRSISPEKEAKYLSMDNNREHPNDQAHSTILPLVSVTSGMLFSCCMNAVRKSKTSRARSRAKASHRACASEEVSNALI